MRVPGKPAVNVQAQVSYNICNREGNVVEEYCRARGSSEGEGDVYTFLRVDFNCPFAEPSLEGVEMLLEVKGCCVWIVIRGEDDFVICKGSYDGRGVLIYNNRARILPWGTTVPTRK